MFSANSSQVSEDRLYVEDVFSTYLYTANNTTQTITNGIDLAGKGGLIWFKTRNTGGAGLTHTLVDSARGNNGIFSSLTSAQSALSGGSGTITLNSNGFTINGGVFSAQGNINNGTTDTLASWTFREAPNFFDVVTYTGDGVAGRTISHNLGVAPGCIIVKQTSGTENWRVYHRSTGNGQSLYLNTADEALATSVWNSTSPTSTDFTVSGSPAVNGSGSTYVAYLFAHDTTSDGIIQCGSFTTDAAGAASVTLGWEPQWCLVKWSAGADNWYIADNMRGMPAAPASGGAQLLYPNTSGAESNGALTRPNATGFTFAGGQASTVYIYIAIRRGPMRTPTSGTSVFSPQIWTGNGTNRVITAGGVSPDLFICGQRTSPFSANKSWWNKLAGQAKYLVSWAAGAEQNTSDSLNTSSNAFLQDGIALGENINMSNTNYATSATYAGYFFKRAPSFFDVVCYTGTGVARTVNHNLGVAPELMIVKGRDNTTNWIVYSSATAATNYLVLDLTNASTAWSSAWNNTAPTSSVFTVGDAAATNFNGIKLVAYLFASCPGVSKVGSYTGNGSSQTINCGFAAGARFVMIKRTDSTGSWWVWDTARGLVSGNDPALQLNSTAAETTGIDSIDPDSSGFIVNQDATTNINVSSATYIYLAVA